MIRLYSPRHFAAFLLAGVLLLPTALPALAAAEAPPVEPGPPATRPAPQAAAELTDDQSAGLLFMREEEKLAQNVYTALNNLWSVRTFSQIAQAEARHQRSTASLLARYGVDDPAAKLPAGQFANQTLQNLYNQLVSDGSESLVTALRVGALVEETDIADLNEALEDATLPADIVRLYENLRSGSYNHLRAFVAQLNRQGVEYTPSVLSLPAYEAILAGR